MSSDAITSRKIISPFNMTSSFSRDYSNNVLVSKEGGIYFIPAYLRIVFLQVQAINTDELTATFLTVLVLNIYYKNLPQQFIDDLQQISFSARNVEEITLKGKGDGKNCMVRNNIDQYTMDFIYRGQLPLRLESDVFWAPFDVIQFKLLLTFHSITVLRNNRLNLLKLNFMDIHDMASKCIILYKDSNMSGRYGLAQGSLNIEFLAIRQLVRQQNMKQFNGRTTQTFEDQIALQMYNKKKFQGYIPQRKIRNWKHVVYSFKMYRYPITTMVFVFVPFSILSFTNLVCFWADAQDVSGRLQAISGLLIAYAAMLPTIRSMLPPSPNITLIEILIYLLSFTIFLGTLETLLAQVNREAGGYTFNWRTNWRFLMSMIITIVVYAIGLILIALYKFLWQPRYNFINDNRFGADYEDYQIVTDAWFNLPASRYLKEKTIMVQPQDRQDLKEIINKNIARPSSERLLPGGGMGELREAEPYLFGNSRNNNRNSDRARMQREGEEQRAEISNIAETHEQHGRGVRFPLHPRFDHSSNTARYWDSPNLPGLRMDFPPAE